MQIPDFEAKAAALQAPIASAQATGDVPDAARDRFHYLPTAATPTTDTEETPA
jgi:hypothetical protein